MKLHSKYYKNTLIIFFWLISIVAIGMLVLIQNRKNITSTKAASNLPVNCNCTDPNNCYPDGCSGKPITADNTFDSDRYNQVCKNIDFGWPPTQEIQKYFCSIRQPDSCFDVYRYKDDRLACFMERWFCHPSLCEGASGSGDCGKYWRLPPGWTAYACVKGPDNDHLTPVWGNLPPNLPGIQQPTQSPQPTNTPFPPTDSPNPTITPVPTNSSTPTAPISTPTPTNVPTPTVVITSYITPETQKSTYIPKGIIFITNSQKLLLNDIQLTLKSVVNNSIIQTIHYTDNLYGTPIHFTLLPVPQGEYSLYVTAKSHDGVIYRQSGACNSSSKKGTCIIANGDPVIVEIKINQLINIAQINENIKRTLDKQKQSMLAAKKLDTAIEQKINNWFLNLIERILGR